MEGAEASPGDSRHFGSEQGVVPPSAVVEVVAAHEQHRRVRAGLKPRVLGQFAVIDRGAERRFGVRCGPEARS
jgi:hypothetical protein